MIKSIYKITNKLNNRCYIGQTTDVKRRFSEHKARGYGRENSILYRAFDKYGLDNFTFEVIESDIENYNEREKYWIAYYNSYEDGYNMTPGGENPPVKYGEEHVFATHSKEEAEEVKNLLLTTNLTVKEIASKMKYNVSSIIRINNGTIWHDDTSDYPLRKELSKDFNEDRALRIIDDLLNTDMTQKDISIKYGVGRSTITAINRGQNHRQDGLEYPIRDKNRDKHSKTILMVDKDTNTTIREFVNANEAAKFLGDASMKNALQACARGETRTSHGYKWRYKE